MDILFPNDPQSRRMQYLQASLLCGNLGTADQTALPNHSSVTKHGQIEFIIPVATEDEDHRHFTSPGA